MHVYISRNKKLHYIGITKSNPVVPAMEEKYRTFLGAILGEKAVCPKPPRYLEEL
jgi:hypothetical protein